MTRRIRNTGSAVASAVASGLVAVLVAGLLLAAVLLVVVPKVLGGMSLTEQDYAWMTRQIMDVAKELQEIDGIEIEIFDDSDLKGGVDNRLVGLATKHNAIILTNDFNLGKMAAAQGIKILNVNDLTQSLRSEMLPGERTTIELIQ